MVKKQHLLITVLFVFAMALFASTTTFAATIGYGRITFVEENDDYKITVNYTASDYNQGEQLTMLVLTGTDTIQFDEVETNKPINIAYIDQAPITGATGSFTFLLDKTFVHNNRIFVKLGSTSLIQPSDKTYTFISGNEMGQINVSEATNAFGVNGQTLLIVTTENTLPEEAIVKVNGKQMYKVANSGAKNKYVAVVTDYNNQNPQFGAENGINQEIKFGDADGNKAINSSDVTVLVDKIRLGSTLNEKVQISADFNGDGQINITDITYLLDYINGNITEIPALNR